jgi:uncharacterized coiled-coil protein SlyX
MALLALVAACLGGAWFGIRNLQSSAYDKGYAAATAVVKQVMDEQATRWRANEVKQQGVIDELSAHLVAAQIDLDRARSAVRVSGDGLRVNLRAAADRPALCTAGDPQAPSRRDDTAAALGDISVSCSGLAEDLAGEAERLAEQLRSLQSYAKAVSDTPP